MSSLIIKDTGVDHLYKDGVPIVEVFVKIADIFQLVARKTALIAQADPFFDRHSSAKKMLIELHGEGSRIANDFISLGASDILPVFQPMQRWMTAFKDVDGNSISMFDYDLLIPGDSEADPPTEDTHTGTIVYRWQIMDTRSAQFKLNYTNETRGNIITDLNIVRNVQRYLIEALQDYMMMEFYKARGYDNKYIIYFKSYEKNRQNIAFWAKSDLSLQTGHNYVEH